MKAVKDARKSCKKSARAKSGVCKSLGKTPASTQRKTSNGQQRGSKSEPQCTICNKKGHYSSSCPRLAQKLLQAVRQHANTAQISKYLAGHKDAKVLGMTGKPQKTLKRRSRAKPWFKKSEQASKSRKVRNTTNKKKNAKRDRARKPKPKKDLKKVCIDKKATESAYKKLKRDQWLWQPHKCTSCFGHLYLLPWGTCRARGRGRLFYRCDECRKHFDVLTFSHLLSLRLPLVIVSRAIDMHFEKSPPPSASDVGRALGCSATPGGSYHNRNYCLAFLLVRRWKKEHVMRYHCPCKLLYLHHHNINLILIIEHQIT